MTRDRSAAPGEWPCISIASDFICVAMPVMARSRCGWKKGDVTAGRVGQHGAPRPSHPATRRRVARRYDRLHVVVVRILADIADIENDGLLAEVLPPVRGAGDFRPDLAGLVHDR